MFLVIEVVVLPHCPSIVDCGSMLSSLQSLAEQEAHLKPQIKELEANVLAAAPDKTKQKQMEKSLEAFKNGKVPTPRTLNHFKYTNIQLTIQTSNK